MTAILDPATPADVERYAGPFLPAYAAAEQALADREAHGCHLQAAAGRAIHGAQWAAVVAREKRQAYAAAVAEWEASPDSSTRHALNAASVEAGAIRSDRPPRHPSPRACPAHARRALSRRGPPSTGYRNFALDGLSRIANMLSLCL
jgi:hypothetical protein